MKLVAHEEATPQDHHRDGWVLALGRLGALFEDSTRLEVWACKSCGHVEFFVPGVGE